MPMWKNLYEIYIAVVSPAQQNITSPLYKIPVVFQVSPEMKMIDAPVIQQRVLSIDVCNGS